MDSVFEFTAERRICSPPASFLCRFYRVEKSEAHFGYRLGQYVRSSHVKCAERVFFKYQSGYEGSNRAYAEKLGILAECLPTVASVS